ncbi:MAG: hypothetical protein P4L51_14705 [Puia sp.]|nr:hypothetical protein [Puia sp.]
MLKSKPQTAPKNSKQKIPEWATNHFKQSLDSNELLFRIIHLSEKGIGVLRGMPQITKVLAKVENSTDDPKSLKRIETAEKEAALAQTEMESGYPVLHGLAVVALWSWLEHFVKGFLTLWILHRRDALVVPVMQKLKIRFGDYIQLNKTEQAAYLVEMLEQELASSLKRGSNRFECLLDPFSLSGQLPEGCSKILFELQQIRNVMAHRNGKVDRRLKADCPWLKLRINQPVLVTSPMLRNYAEASVQFLVELLYRVGDTYGKDLRPKDSDAT